MQVARRRYHSLQGGSCPNSFDATNFLRILRGRTLLLVGDSVQTQFFVSLACLLHSRDPGSLHGHTIAWKGPSNLRKRCRGFKQCHYMYGCASFTGGVRLCLCFVVGISGSFIQQCMRSYNATSSDVVVYGSIGVHYRELAKFYRQKPDFAAKAEVKAVLGVAAPEHNRGYLIFREVSAQHFNAPGGHFNLSRGDYNRWEGNATCSSDHTLASMWEHQRWNRVTVPAMESAGVPILRSWRPTSLAWDAHVGYGDCTHFCLPGVPDDWSLQLYDLLRQAPLAPVLSLSSGSIGPTTIKRTLPQHQLPRPACPLAVPDNLMLPTSRPRPEGLPPWSVDANVSQHVRRPLLFSPLEDSPDGTHWESSIRASQNPAECKRYLLIEDNSFKSGFGIDSKLYATALLYAMRKGRVLLHVPSSTPGQPYRHLSTEPPTGRWCDRPPYTYDCMWEPLSYCDPPDPSLPVSTSPYDRRLPSAPSDSAPIAKITSLWMWKSTGLWRKGSFASLHGAYRYLFRPRQWVREIADCIMKRDGLEPRRYVGVFVRLSGEKAKEVKESLPKVPLYVEAVEALLRAFGMRHAFVSTASPSALVEFEKLLTQGNKGTTDYAVSYTDNPRAEGDKEQHTGGGNANWTMSMGAVAAVNLLVSSRAAVVVSLASSTWTSLQRELHSEPPWNRSLIGRCFGSQQYLTADLHTSVSMKSAMQYLSKVKGCHWRVPNAVTWCRTQSTVSWSRNRTAARAMCEERQRELAREVMSGVR